MNMTKLYTKYLPTGLCPILAETIPQGVAYHHSGLVSDERKILEDAYRAGTINVLVATSTLSTGINLPAKAVIFYKPYISTKFIDPARYKQMSGRAGRTGFDTKGDSIMICNIKEKERVFNEVINAKIDTSSTAQSAMTQDDTTKCILEAISSGLVIHLRDLKLFLSKTLKYILYK